MPTRLRIASLGVAILSVFGQAGVLAAPVLTRSEGGFQSAWARVNTSQFDTIGAPSTLDSPRLWSTPSADWTQSQPGSGSVGSAWVPTYGPERTGGAPLPGIAATVDVSGTRRFEGSAPAPWSASASAIASAQTGRIELQSRGISYQQSATGAESMYAFASAGGSVYNFFQPQFSHEVAAALSSDPQYLTLTATLVGHTSRPGQVQGSLRIFSDYLNYGNLQELSINVEETGQWTRQYQLQYAFTGLLDYTAGTDTFDCLQRPDLHWVRCQSTAAVEASFSLFTGYEESEANTLSVLLSWSVPDTVQHMYVSAADWGAPLAVDLPASPVPEPGSAALLLTGLGVLAAIRGGPRRRYARGWARGVARGVVTRAASSWHPSTGRWGVQMPVPARAIAAFLGAALAAFGQAAVQAAPVVTSTNGGAQSAAATAQAFVLVEVGAPTLLNAPSLSGSPTANVSSSPGYGTVGTGVVPTYGPPGAGSAPLAGATASASISGTRVFEGMAPAPWSTQAVAISSSQTGRVQLETTGGSDTRSLAGEAMFGLGAASGSIYNAFAAVFSPDVAAALATTPQYLTLTATLVGRTARPGQVEGSLRIFSDYQTQGNLQALSIDVQETGEWTQQYALQYAFTGLEDYFGTGNCLQRPGVSWVECLSYARVEANFALSSLTGDSGELSVLLSWSVPDSVLGLRTDAASWGAPLAVDLPTTAVPEPASAAMLLLGLGMLAGVQRMRGRRIARACARRAATAATAAESSFSAR